MWLISIVGAENVKHKYERHCTDAQQVEPTGSK